MNEYPVHVLNKILPSKRELYDLLTNSSDFALKLPSISSKAVSIKYLLSVANGTVFSIKQSAYRETARKSFLSKVDYYAELGKLSPNLGFEVDALPDKKWLKNVLYSLQPDHDFFKNESIPTMQLSER